MRLQSSWCSCAFPLLVLQSQAGLPLEPREHTYNYADAEFFRLVGDRPLPAGASTLELTLDYDKPMSGGPATVAMKVDGRPAGRLRLPHTVPFLFSIHETMDIGTDLGGPVTPDYPTALEFDGVIREVAIDIR